MPKIKWEGAKEPTLNNENILIKAILPNWCLNDVEKLIDVVLFISSVDTFPSFH